MINIVELLVVLGKIERRYLIDGDRHTKEILEFWTPLVARLLEAPGERLWHGFAEMPYWEASMALSPALKHLDLDDLYWLSFYAGPGDPEPYYVGALIPSKWSPDKIYRAVSMVVATSGSTSTEDMASVFNDIANEGAALVGCYWPMGIPKDPSKLQKSVKATGECAAILAQLIIDSIGR
jgi:hypothetical protein